MDLDDSFTEKLLNRTRARREYLTVKKNESPVICSKKRPVLSEEQQIINEDVEDVINDDSPKRQRLSLPSEDNEYEKENVHMEDIGEEEAFVPYKASFNRGLAALRNKHNSDSANEDKTSYGSSSESEVNECKTYMFSTNSSELCTSRKTRLANLASHINQWEDDLQTPHTTNNVTSSVLKKPVSNSKNFSASSSYPSHSKSSASKTNSSNKVSFDTNALSHSSGVQGTFMFGDSLKGGSNSEFSHSRMPPVSDKGDAKSSGGSNKITGRIGVWEQAVQAALESDENVKSPLKTPVNAQWNKDSERESSAEESEDEEEEEEDVNSNFDQKDEKLNNKHIFGNVPKNDNLDKSFDPAELPLSARKALFEKALLGGNTEPALPPEKLSVAQRAAMFETATKTNSKVKPPSNFAVQKSATLQKSSTVKSAKAVQVQHSPAKSVLNVAKSSPIKKTLTTPSQAALSPGKSVGHHTRLVQQQLVKSAANDWQQKEIVAKAAGERKTEISNLVNHWETLCSKSSVKNAHSDEEIFRKPQNPEEQYESEDEEEADYESDLESERNEKESESDWNEQNEVENPHDLSQFDTDVYDSEQEVFNPKRFSAEAGLTNFDVDTDCTTDNDIESYNSRPNSNYTSVSSDSMSLKSSVSEPNSYSVTKSQTSSSGSSTGSYRASDLGEEVAFKPCSISSDSPLCHTVSFYRRQKQVTRTPPMKTIVRREPIVEVPENDDDNQAEIIQERIKLLQDEILRQQTVISQTSQALNLCHATAEFSGSTEQVEGERLLLIATQKRQACLNEIQRLKSHGAQGLNIADGSGTLTISDIQLPLKRDFISAQLEGKISDAVHCFLCLIRHGPQVIVTQMVSTSDKISDGALCFTNHIKLQQLPPDFSVVFEIYALQTKKEVLPHDKKYHIKKDHSKVRLTPKGKKGDGKLLFPGVSSPGGPNAVRSPSFSVIGFTRFTIQNHNKKCFTLDKVPFTSPLEGVLKVRLHLHAEHKVAEKGFLTMFEDVSGFGAWHRRWCSLDSRHLSFWKYPDDEVKKEPIGVIDLRQCVTSQVRLVSRDICARPHTFQLLTVRPQAKEDRNTLVSQSMDTLTSTKHLISADTKEERISWCNKLNEALTNLRKWDPRALGPIEEKQE